MELRQSERNNIKLRAVMVLGENHALTIRGYASDISRRGLCFICLAGTSSIPLAGTYVEVYLELPVVPLNRPPRVMRCQGTVVWAGPQDQQADPINIGVEIFRMSFGGIPEALVPDFRKEVTGSGPAHMKVN